MTFDVTVIVGHILTAVGLFISIAAVVEGFRSFRNWQRQKLEARRIEIATDALALAHESRLIFDNIRQSRTDPSEWKDMPAPFDRREQRGRYYAILKRISLNRDFFTKARDLQVRCTTIFGRDVEAVFLLLHKSRRQIEVSADMLMCDPELTVNSQENLDLWNKMQSDVDSGYSRVTNTGDEVGKMLSDFVDGIERLCRPIVEHELRKQKSSP